MFGLEQTAPYSCFIMGPIDCGDPLVIQTGAAPTAFEAYAGYCGYNVYTTNPF
jgi:hypothetical protein